MKVIKNENGMIHNTNRADRAANVDVVPMLQNLPKPPGWFNSSKRAKAIYKELGTKLLEVRGMREFDYYAVLMLATALDQYVWATGEIERKNKNKMGSGYVQNFATGASNISAELTVREKAHKQILELNAKFGLTLKDRVGLTQNTDPQQTNLLDMFTFSVAK